jgi:multicomponent Na+:H+ antiporter subunit B
VGFFSFNLLPKGSLYKLFSAGIIPLYNVAIGIKVGAALSSIFLAFVLLKIARERSKK